MRAEENLGCFFDCVRSCADKAILHLEAMRRKIAGELPTFKERLGINNNYAEWCSCLVRLDECALHDAAGGIGQDYVTRLDLLGGACGNQLVRGGDPLKDKVVDGAEEMGFCV